MAYRKMTVNGTQYQYVIGESNIHIKGVGNFKVRSTATR